MAARKRVRPAARRFGPMIVGSAVVVAGLVLVVSSAQAVVGRAPAAERGCAAARALPDRPLRVGIVNQGGVRAGMGAVIYRGLMRAVRELGVEGRVVEQGPKDQTGSAGFSYLARQGFDLIVGFGLPHLHSLDAAALRFPDTCFLSLDGPVSLYAHRPRNLEGTVFRVEQAAFLAGYLAAEVEQERPRPHVVSTVGGAPIAPVMQFIAGFQAGARRADPKVTLLNGYAQEFANQAPCRRLALQQIARGSGVVFQVAGLCGLGALDAAKQKGVWGVGVDNDQSSLGRHVLTSVLKNFDVALFRAVESLQEGGFRPGRTVESTLADGGVGLGRISPRVPRSLRAKLAQLRRQILAGRIVVPREIS